jgi:multidrug resistance efflux pump
MAANDRSTIAWLQAKLAEAEAAQRRLAADLAHARAELEHHQAEIDLERRRHAVRHWRDELP